MSRIKMNFNGCLIECTPAQARDLLRSVTANAKGEETVQYKKASEVRKAVASITGDTSAEFVLNVLKAQPAGSKPDGSMIPIHAVYHGVNEGIRKYGDDPRTVTGLMAEKGIIDVRGAKGGVIISLPRTNIILRKATS
jgi:hypothetical protein